MCVCVFSAQIALGFAFCLLHSSNSDLRMSHQTNSSIESALIAEGGPRASVGEHPNAITNRYDPKFFLF